MFKAILQMMTLMVILVAVQAQAQEFVPAQIIYALNEDGAFSYVDRQGQLKNYWNRTITEAQAASVQCVNCEVFVFERKPVAKKDKNTGRMVLYKNGAILSEQNYEYTFSEKYFFEKEAQMLLSLSKATPEKTKKYFFYYGHHVPEANETNYFQSFQGKSFSIMGLYQGMKAISSRLGVFDLLMLSSCENGTPLTAYYGAMVSRWMVASPANLYLSMLSTAGVKDWEDPEAAGKEISEESFRSLTRETKTEVSVALYDLQKIKSTVEQSPDQLRAFNNLYHSIYTGSSVSMQFKRCEDTVYSALADLPVETLKYQAHLISPKKTPFAWSCPVVKP